MTSLTNKTVFFRLDFGGIIGRGHLSRCLNVAEALNNFDIESVFIIRARGNLTQSLTIPFKVIWLKEATKEITSDVTTWLTETENDEIKDISNIISAPSTVILDHYGFSARAHKLFKDAGHTLILFNDDEERAVIGDLIINYNLDTNTIPKRDHHLYGTQYTPLNRLFAEERKGLIKNRASQESIGVYLGGIDFSIFKLFAEALIKNARIFNSPLLWVCASQKELEFLEKSFPSDNIKTFINLPNLIDVYKSSRFFVGTCGVAFLERACLGIPQLVFLTADNQKKIANTVNEKQIACFGGDLRVHDRNILFDIIRESFSSLYNRSDIYTHNALNLTDGLGAQRIAKEIIKWI